MNKTRKQITFSGNFLSKDDEQLYQEEFTSLFQGQETEVIGGSIVHSYSFETISNYLKISFSDGSTFPRNPQVVNTETNKLEPNPRQPNQIEPKDYFAIIDFSTSFLWVSNSKKRGMVIDYLRNKFKKSKIVVKDVYDQDEFINSLKKLDELRLTSVPELFSDAHDVTQALKDQINQFEAVEAVLHLKYKDKFVGNNLSDKFKSIFNNKDKYKGIMISGRNERNLGMLFNSNVFSKKIDFKANVDENEMFNPQEIFSTLITKIENENR